MTDELDTEEVMVESPGAVLRAAREQAGISVEDMAGQLNWLKSYVVAIEEDQYGAFSNQIFAKGYLRFYARRLDVDVDESNLLGNYERLTGASSSSSAESLETNISTLDKSVIGKYVGLVFFLLVIAVLWWFRANDESERSKVVISSSAVDSTELATDTLDIEYADSNEADENKVNVSAGEEVLYFNFFEECWLEVKDVNSNLIYADLRRKGEAIAVSGLPPFEILVGQASAVKLRYQNEVIPLEPSAGRNFVRLRIGG